MPPAGDLVAEAGRLAAERDRLCDRILARLAAPMPDREKAKHVRALGKLGTPKAIDYLLQHHDFSISSEGGIAGLEDPDPIPFPCYPCLWALDDAGLGAVPQAVEAYITWPADRWPEGLLHFYLLHNDRKRARVAYIYAQGYLFANKENGHHRDAVLELIKHAPPLIVGDLPYPPPWMR